MRNHRRAGYLEVGVNPAASAAGPEGMNQTAGLAPGSAGAACLPAACSAAGAARRLGGGMLRIRLKRTRGRQYRGVEVPASFWECVASAGPAERGVRLRRTRGRRDAGAEVPALFRDQVVYAGPTVRRPTSAFLAARSGLGTIREAALQWHSPGNLTAADSSRLISPPRPRMARAVPLRRTRRQLARCTRRAN